jgi:hypothetical protein
MSVSTVLDWTPLREISVRAVVVVAALVGDLPVQRGFQQAFGQLLQYAALPGQP